jgi:hypothetical protein
MPFHIRFSFHDLQCNSQYIDFFRSKNLHSYETKRATNNIRQRFSLHQHEFRSRNVCVFARVSNRIFAYIFNSQSQELKTKRQRSNIGQRNFRVQPEFAHIFKSQALNTYHPKEVVILTNFKLNFDVTLELYNDLYQTTLPNYQRNCKTLHTFTLNTLNVCVYIYKMKSINNSIRNTSVSKMARSARRIVGSLTFVHTQKVQF